MLARPTWAEVDLDVVVDNARIFRALLSSQTRLMVAVKANAYGHGAIPVALALEEHQAVDWLGVASIEEAMELRNAGVKLPMLVLGYTPTWALEEAARQQVAIAMYEEDALLAADAVGRQTGTPVLVHVKVDTGMGRLGVRDHEQAMRICQLAHDLQGVSWQGLFTHFSTADESDKAYTKLQFERFESLRRALAATVGLPPLVHCANSAATIDMPETHGTMVRVGIGLYGCLPSAFVDAVRVGGIRQALSVKSRVIRIESMEPGSPISYGRRYATKREERIATVPIGYGDGYSRLLTGKAQVLVQGRRVPVVGAICMDQLMIDVTDVPQVQVEDEVVLYGNQGDEYISLDEIAAHLGTISYEVSCAVGQRVPRLYRHVSGVSYHDHSIRNF